MEESCQNLRFSQAHICKLQEACKLRDPIAPLQPRLELSRATACLAGTCIVPPANEPDRAA